MGAISTNVTVTDPVEPGHITVYPCGIKPNASSLNFVAGRMVPNAVITQVSPAGEVCFYSSQPTHLIADVTRWLDG